ncbi:MAG: sulfurtransferase-like selenium metabolism protein YedF [Deltaproteobacteria bacterium]|jgi:selenium metabolism protein YedF|nr:sulfurtransferase-like selenium metabolism protein YedF [Deltaproteobacteria bacterium]
MTTIDALGQPCPLPVIAAKKALKAAQKGETIVIVVDNEIAVQNLTKMAKALGHEVKSAPIGPNFEVTLTVSDPKTPAETADAGGLVVTISQGTLGHGDDKLGQNLLKAFIFSLIELEKAPEYLLFFNGGAYLTCEGSDSLKDLAALAERGTIIGTCGACLNYYGLTDKLKVGSPTNMLAIVTAMSQAKKLINV